MYNPHNEHYIHFYYNNNYKNILISKNSIIYSNKKNRYIQKDLSIKDNLSLQENNLLLEIKKYT